MQREMLTPIESYPDPILEFGGHKHSSELTKEIISVFDDLVQ